MHKRPATFDDGKLSATVFRMTLSELQVFAAVSHIRYLPTDTRDNLRDKILKAAGYGNTEQAKQTLKPTDLIPSEKLALTQQAIANEIALLRTTADVLESLSKSTIPSPEWLANQAQSEIRYCHGRTHIARLISMSKG